MNNQIESVMINIRKATEKDLDDMMSCYDKAKEYMRASGNRNQWINGYPSRAIVSEDITKGNSYVGEDEDGGIVVAFAFIIGEDPTYSVIENGEWPNALPYGTIHRIASSGRYKGMLEKCVEYCMSLIGNIRLDTHEDNATMRNAAERLGFTRCGIIHIADGSPRIAFQKTSPSINRNT